MGMTRELQDKAWAGLPKEFRKEVRAVYDEHLHYEGQFGIIVCELDSIFGEHNLISDVEPEEDEANTGSSSQNSAENCDNGNLISNDCKAEARFMVGDKVLISDDERISEEFRGCVGKVVYINSTDKRTVDVGGGIAPDCFHISHLAPYHEPKPKGDAWELNLREMLKWHEDDTFYSPVCGETIILTPHPVNGFRIASQDYLHGRKSGYWNIGFDGKADKDGCVMLFPSRALYEKHPLDAKAAWAEWQEGQKPKVELLVSYTIRNGVVNGCGSFEPLKFKSEDEARQAAEAVRKILEEFHKGKKQ